MRIVNGRLFKDQSVGCVTSYTHNRESVVVCVITSLQNFQSVLDFEIYEFHEYSNHALLYLSLKTCRKLEPQTKHERTFHKYRRPFE